MISRNLSVSPERAVTPEWQKKSERRSMSSDGMSQRSSQSSTDWGYTSYNNFTASIKGSATSNNARYHVSLLVLVIGTLQTLISRSSSYSKYSSAMKDSSYDESYEDDYSNSFSYSGNKSSSSNGGRMALSALKYEPAYPN